MKVIKLNKKILAICIAVLMVCSLALAVRAPKTRLTSTNAAATYHILVDVEESKMYILQDGVCIKTYKCSGRKVLYSVANWYVDYYRKSNMGRGLWRQVDGI